MGLSRKAIDEFKKICRDEFGADLSDTEAEQRALEVLEFFWLLSVGDADDSEIALTDQSRSFYDEGVDSIAFP